MQLVRFRLYTALFLAFAGSGLAQGALDIPEKHSEAKAPVRDLGGGTAVGDWQPRYQKGERLLREGRTEEALAEFKPALAEVGAAGRGAVLDALGRAELQAGHYREAKRHLEESVPLWEAHTRQRAVALSNLGRVCLELKEYTHAEAVFLQALEIWKDEARLWQSLGQAQDFQGRHRDAEESYQRALSLADRTLAPSVSSDLAGLLVAKRQHAKAAVILREAIAQVGAGQARARMLVNLGMLHLKLNQKSQAAAELGLALADMESTVGPQHPDVATILELYNETLRKSGRKAEAVAAALRAAAIRSSFARHTTDRRTSVDWRDLK